MYRITSTNGIVVIGLSDSRDTKVYAYADYCPEMHNKQNCSPIISTTCKSTPPDSPTRLESSLFSPTNKKLNSPHFPHPFIPSTILSEFVSTKIMVAAVIVQPNKVFNWNIYSLSYVPETWI